MHVNFYEQIHLLTFPYKFAKRHRPVHWVCPPACDGSLISLVVIWHPILILIYLLSWSRCDNSGRLPMARGFSPTGDAMDLVRGHVVFGIVMYMFPSPHRNLVFLITGDKAAWSGHRYSNTSYFPNMCCILILDTYKQTLVSIANSGKICFLTIFIQKAMNYFNGDLPSLPEIYS